MRLTIGNRVTDWVNSRTKRTVRAVVLPLVVVVAAALTAAVVVLEPALGSPGADSVTSAQAAVERGNQAWLEQRLDAAESAYREALRLDPDLALAHRKLGGLYLIRHDLGAAVNAFQAAIGADPADASAFIGLGLAYLHRQQWGRAHAALHMGIQRDPARFEQVEPVLEHIEARMTHPVPSPDGTAPEMDYATEGGFR